MKLDRAFVRDIGVNANANTLIQSLVSLASALELSVVAEGVENEDQLALLRLTRCDFIQGFFFSKPVAADDIDALLAQGGLPRAAGSPPAGGRAAATAA